jgi:dipeptidyl-peptidase-4
MSLFFAIGLMLSMQASEPDDSLLTVAESSDYTQTSTSAQVIDLIERIKERSTIMRATEMGRTVEGKPIPLVILANPPVATIEEATQSGKPVCFIMANIHAGEVEGKEACLMLAREIALAPSGGPNHSLLKNLIIVLAPNYNADGNDTFDAVEKNRPGQIGPIQCGVRPNSAGLDLNRDYIKLEAPESRALVKFLTDWDPLITIDCHTTNGSHHRYVLTYEAPLNPSGHPAPIDFVRNKLLPEATKRIKDHTGYDMWHYGNFNAEHTIWATYSAEPRFGGPYQGLRGQMSILSEAYSYAPYEDRVLATREFIREILQFTSDNAAAMMAIREQARTETVERGRDPRPDDVVGIRHRIAAFTEPAIVKGFANTPGKGGVGGAAITSHDNLGPPKDYTVIHDGRFEPTLSVSRPYAYIIPPMPNMEKITEKLRQHGIAVTLIEGFATCDQYRIKAIHRAEREFQGHHEITLEVEAGREYYRLRSGTHIVRTDQALGTLAVYLLEPQSEDGLATWNFFDDHLAVGKPFPILRVRTSGDLENESAAHPQAQ